MENTKTIRVGNWTVAEIALQGITIEEAKKTFNYVDPRQVETAYYIANPKPKGRKKKAKPSEE